MSKKVRFLETTSSHLDSLPFVDGRFVYTTDDDKFYRESATGRVGLNEPDIIMSVADGHLNIVTSNRHVDIEVINGEKINITF